MSDEEQALPEIIHTKIWCEEAEPDNPFAAAKCLCAGYDVYGEILHKASWFEYLYLLFKLERPQPWQAHLLEKIAIAIANPGIRDHSVRAAMNAGVGGSTSASALMAALAVGAGHLNGAREVFVMMQWWSQCGFDLQQWKDLSKNPPKHQRANVWGDIEHMPGFDPTGTVCSQPVLQTLTLLASMKEDGYLHWLQQNRDELENFAESPLAMSGVIATAFLDLEFNPDQAEMLYLMMRLPGAAVHALEQKQLGWKKYPFFGSALKITNDPLTGNK
jgi:citrate synthase